jgi:putative ABC transport system permease protein
MTHLKLAFKNTLRNRARSLITLAAVAFGCITLIVSGGLMVDGLTQLREGLIEGSIGHMQISKKGYFERGAARPFDFSIAHPDEVVSLVSAVPGVRYAAPRLRFYGMLSADDTTISFVGEGVDPAKERELSSGMAIVKGQNLAADAPHDVILGAGLARAVEVAVGAPAVLVANSKEGAVNAMDVSVRGLFATGSKELDDNGLRLPLAAAQRLLHSNTADTIVVLLDRTDSTDKVKAVLEARFRERGWALEIKPWYEMADFYKKAEAFFEREFVILFVVIGTVVVLGVFNTLNMSVLERVGEIGTMMALGYRRADVALVFIAEGALLGVLGGLLGLASGYLAARMISAVGIPLPPPPGRSVAVVSRVMIVPALFWLSFLLSAVTALISSVYPALRASRLEIAEALRQNI